MAEPAGTRSDAYKWSRYAKDIKDLREVLKPIRPDGSAADTHTDGPITEMGAVSPVGKPIAQKVEITGDERAYRVLRRGGRLVAEETKIQAPSGSDGASEFDMLGIGLPSDVGGDRRHKTPGIGPLTGEEVAVFARDIKKTPRDNSMEKMVILESLLVDWCDVGELLGILVPPIVPRRMAWIAMSMRFRRYKEAGLLARRRVGHRYQYKLTRRGQFRLVYLYRKLELLRWPSGQDRDEKYRLEKNLCAANRTLAREILMGFYPPAET